MVRFYRDQALMALSEPMPLGVLMLVQVPAGTFQGVALVVHLGGARAGGAGAGGAVVLAGHGDASTFPWRAWPCRRTLRSDCARAAPEARVAKARAPRVMERVVMLIAPWVMNETSACNANAPGRSAL
jgi:hypothetical protein